MTHLLLSPHCNLGQGRSGVRMVMGKVYRGVDSLHLHKSSHTSRAGTKGVDPHTPLWEWWRQKLSKSMGPLFRDLVGMGCNILIHKQIFEYRDNLDSGWDSQD